MTDAEVESMADDIFQKIRCLDNPQDAASVLTMAQWKLIEASFGPEERMKAIESIDATADLLKRFINERLQ